MFKLGIVKVLIAVGLVLMLSGCSASNNSAMNPIFNPAKTSQKVSAAKFDGGAYALKILHPRSMQWESPMPKSIKGYFPNVITDHSLLNQTPKLATSYSQFSEALVIGKITSVRILGSVNPEAPGSSQQSETLAWDDPGSSSKNIAVTVQISDKYATRLAPKIGQQIEVVLPGYFNKNLVKFQRSLAALGDVVLPLRFRRPGNYWASADAVIGVVGSNQQVVFHHNLGVKLADSQMSLAAVREFAAGPRVVIDSFLANLRLG